MQKTHTINLTPNHELEEYEKNDSNLALVKIDVKNDPTARNCGEGYRVKFYLSSSAMIGLGTSLIRQGLAAQGHGTVEMSDEPIVPIANNSPDYGEMGFYLVPGSADVMFFINDFGTIQKVIENIDKDNKS